MATPFPTVGSTQRAAASIVPSEGTPGSAGCIPKKLQSSAVSATTASASLQAVEEGTNCIDSSSSVSEMSGVSEATDLSSADEDSGDDALSNRDLVRFLQTLESVPCEDLPAATAPPSMHPHAALRHFQLQALHWLLSREGTGSSPSAATASGCLSREASALPSANSTALAASTEALPFDLPECASEADVVRGGIFADFMGLGKTRTMIALCEATRGPRYDRVTGSQVQSAATLVVCPASLMHQWQREIEACVAPAPRVLLYHGTRKARLSLFDLAQGYDYVLVTYQALRHDPPLYPQGPGRMRMVYWNRIILDEAHTIRNMRAQQTRACLGLSSRLRWVVTATPVHNSVNDLFPLLKFLKVPYFSQTQWWNQEIVHPFNTDPQHPKPVTALRWLFSSLLLRRTPDTIIHGRKILELPPKTVSTEIVHLTREERTYYEAVRDSATHKISQQQRLYGLNTAAFGTAFEMLMRCRQTCLHPYIVVAALRRIRLQTSADPSKGHDHAAASLPSPATSDYDAARMAQNIAALNQFVDSVLRRRLAVKEGRFLADLIDQLRHQQLEKRECIICLDRLLSPTILPCAHVFCEECIRHALELKSECPMCKRKTRSQQVLVVPMRFLAAGTDGSTSSTANGATSSARATIQELAARATPEAAASVTQWPLALSSKTQRLLEIIRRIPADERVVVFSSFVTYLTFTQHCLLEAGIPCALYTGSLTLKQKDALLHRFSAQTAAADDGPAPRVLLATTAACGVGLNLTCANHCVLMEPVWSPAAEDQALHRVHRMGQVRPVTVVRLVAHGTVEEKVEALCHHKRQLTGYCFQSGRNARIRAEELLALFTEEQTETSSSESD